MIFYNGKDIAVVYYNGKNRVVAYYNGKLVWEAIRSCFGKGYWIQNKPWSNTDAYKN